MTLTNPNRDHSFGPNTYQAVDEVVSANEAAIKDGTEEKKAGLLARVAGAPKPDAAQGGLPAGLLHAGVALGSDGSYQLTTDSFKFREHLKRTMKPYDARDELLQGLSYSWEDASSLRNALSPMGASAGDRVKDSLVRMLLQVDPLQAELTNLLFEKLGMETDGDMALSRLIVSQFRCLDHVVDGEALINTVSQTLQAPALGVAFP